MSNEFRGMSIEQFRRRRRLRSYGEFQLAKARLAEVAGIEQRTKDESQELLELDRMIDVFEEYELLHTFVNFFQRGDDVDDQWDADNAIVRYNLNQTRKEMLKNKQREARLKKLIYIPTEEEIAYPTFDEAEAEWDTNILGVKRAKRVYEDLNKNAIVLQKHLKYFTDKKKAAREEG